MRKQLIELRKKMKAQGIALYLIPTTDPHGSEYVHEHFKCREYVSGFNGSAGTLVVTDDWAGLWTDGRYFIQAAQQLAGTAIQLMKMGEEGVPELEEYLELWAKNREQTGGYGKHLQGSGGQGDRTQKPVIGFDGRVVSEEMGRKLEEWFSVVYDVDLVGEIWPDRPDIIPSGIYEIPLEVTGETASSKLQRLREAMAEADYLLLTSLEEIAWLYNLRGMDITYTPVFYGFTLISKTEDCLYVMDEKYLSQKRDTEDGAGLCKRYDKVFDDLAKLRNCTVLLDRRTASYAIRKCFDDSVKVVMADSPVALMKAVKNQREIEATRNAHIKDGAAMVEFLCWLKRHVGKVRITEQSAAAYLERCRRQQGARDLSFETISGYESHGAIVHYAVTEGTDAEIKPEGFLLVDSGGQYEDGTTDITRTISLGKVNDARKQIYTAVLKGHIALALARFDRKTTGAELDALARKPLQELGFDYNHGTGHGVGHMLSVHEGPNTISKRGTACHILPGMITSDEPGIYLEGKYGVRIENELLCMDAMPDHGILAGSRDHRSFWFETITFCPYERDAIDRTMLTEEEIRYVNDYHEKVYHILKPHISREAGEWLQEVCCKL